MTEAWTTDATAARTAGTGVDDPSAAAEPSAEGTAAGGSAPGGAHSDGSARATGSRDASLVHEGDIAADYLERLLDIADFDGDIDLDVENDRAVVAIVGGDLRSLVGPRGETLDALQELTRLAVQQQTGNRSRLMLDVAGHRQERRTELQALAVSTADKVRSSGEPARLAPMNPFERKVVHDAVAAQDGVTSESEGEEPNRRVVVLPA